MRSGRVKHHRRKSSRMGREFKKPTDIRRQFPDDLHTLTYRKLKKRGKITEQITVKNWTDEEGVLHTRTRYNVVIDGIPRTVTLEK